MEKEKTFDDSFARSIVELKLASDRLVEGRGVGAGVFTIKYQILYLIASFGVTSPQELIFELNMAKSNLALMAKKMISEGLIESIKDGKNKKQIYYKITEKGKKELDVKLRAIDNLYVNDKQMLKRLSSTIDSLKKLK